MKKSNHRKAASSIFDLDFLEKICSLYIIFYGMFFFSLPGDRKRKNSTEEKVVPVKNGKRYIFDNNFAFFMMTSVSACLMTLYCSVPFPLDSELHGLTNNIIIVIMDFYFFPGLQTW